MSFVQLQVSSAYSLLNSTLSIEALVHSAKERGYSAVALTDTNVLYGAVDFYKLCKKNHLQPIIGLTLEIQGVLSKEQTFPLVLLAKNNKGYQDLIQLSSKKMTLVEQVFSPEELYDYTDDLIAITPGRDGEIEHFLLQEENQKAKEVAHFWKNCFTKNNFYLGLQLHSELISIQSSLESLAETEDILLTAVNDVQYENEQDAFTWQVLRAIDKGTQLDSEEVENKGTHDLSEPQTMIQRYQAAGYHSAAEQTEKVAQQINIEIALHQQLLPKYPLAEGLQTTSFLKALCMRGLEERVPDADERYTERLSHELDVIKKMGFEDYFLIVWDLMAYAHQANIVTGAGRGSAAGSLVAFVLKITDVDPIQYDLLFERFLNEERYNMPDIDLDFPDNRREEMLTYVKEKYGFTHVAQIITFGTLAAKMAIRDTARVFGLTQQEAGQWSKAIPNQLGMTLEKAYHSSKALQQLVSKDRRHQLLFDSAKKIEGLPRHISTHAAGVVISDQPLTQNIPVQKGSGQILLTQYAMGNVEEIGLLKMDFLGLKNLSILDNALKVIRYKTGKALQLQDIPMNDEQTLEVFKAADTVGIFQFESTGIKHVLQRLQPESIEDVAAVNALYRPGPMEQINPFIQRKKGLAPIEYPHQSLKEILEVTYGVMVYQEQVMQVASKMAGYTLGQADILRRAIGKKKKEMIDRERTHFITGAVQNGYQEEDAQKVYDYIEHFANYGFNRSHAVAYSFIAYQMAYLKAHYPQAFFIALLNSAAHQSEKLKDYLFEARSKKISVYPPDINQSQAFFTQKENGILFGFSSIKGLRRDMIAEIIQNRKKDGQYKDFIHFLRRLDTKWLKEDYLRPLIYAGAFNAFDQSIGTLLRSLESMISSVTLSGNNIELFEILQPKYIEGPDLTIEEKLEAEEKYLGIYLSGHPAEKYESILKMKQGTLIKDLLPGKTEKIIGLVKSVKKITTKKGEPMAFMEVSDLSGSCSVTLFPKVYRRYVQETAEGNLLFIEGKAEKKAEQEIQLLVYQMEPAEKLATSFDKGKFFIRITDEQHRSDKLNQIKQLLQSYKGTIPVILYYEKENKTIMLSESFWVSNEQTLKESVEQILGKGNAIFVSS